MEAFLALGKHDHRLFNSTTAEAIVVDVHGHQTVNRRTVNPKILAPKFETKLAPNPTNWYGWYKRAVESAFNTNQSNAIEFPSFTHHLSNMTTACSEDTDKAALFNTRSNRFGMDCLPPSTSPC